jgi:hypothetical protein
MTHEQFMNEWARRVNYVRQLFEEGEIDLEEMDERNRAINEWFETEYPQ